MATHQPDVMCLQETKLEDEKFPHAEIAAAGYRSEFFGQKTYNGVALLEPRSGRTTSSATSPGFDDPQARVIAATVDGPARHRRLFSERADAGQRQVRLQDALARRAVRLDSRASARAIRDLVLMGDYNIAPQDQDVHDPAAWEGQIMCTPEERGHFESDLRRRPARRFRLFEQPPKSWSWWDYRQLAFQKGRGLRIDHILVSEALKPRVTACSIDRPTRKNERPSDHAPVLAEIGPGALKG